MAWGLTPGKWATRTPGYMESVQRQKSMMAQRQIALGQLALQGRQQSLAEREAAWRRQSSEQGAAGLSQLVTGYQQAYGEARSANEQRYQQLLGIANQTTGQRQADVRSDYARQGANIRQGLARQGMAGTTVAPTMQLGVQREQQSSLNRLADQMQQTKLGIIERREDQYPDAGLMTSLVGMLGQGGGNMGSLMGSLGGMYGGGKGGGTGAQRIPPPVI